MKLLQNAICVTLLVCCLSVFVRSDTSTSQDGGKCQLVTEDGFTFTTSVTHNGVTYHDVVISVTDSRGYKCKQASGTTKYCVSSHRKDSPFYVNSALTTTLSEKKKISICLPSAHNTVTKTVDVELGGSMVSVTAEWQNITACECDTPPWL